MSLSADTVAASIAGLAVPGVSIKGLDAIPEAVGREYPVLFPKPDGFLGGLEIERASFDGKYNVFYTMSYTYCHAPVGEGRGLFAHYQAMVRNVMAILDAILTNHALTGCIDIQSQALPAFGPVFDPSGQQFHGCTFAFRVMEFSEV